MVSKIKSRVQLGIPTITPEREESLGAEVPCYNLVGTIQRLCAYSKAMIDPGIARLSLISKLVCGSGKFSAAPFSLSTCLLLLECSLVAEALIKARGKRREAPC